MTEGLRPYLDSKEMAELHARTSEKWRRHAFGILPSSIAEMDFPIAQEIRAAISACVSANDTGYAFTYTRDSPVQRALAAWLTRRFHWWVPPEQILFYADVMRVIETGIELFSAPGDAITVDVPAYPPILDAARERGRELVYNPMIKRANRWEFDLDSLERSFREGSRVYVMCNPHNPTGRVYDIDELIKIVELARKYRIAVLCDEVHNPLVYNGKRHIPFASIPAARRVPTLTGVSASKAWNIAGLKCAFGIPGDELVAGSLLALPSRTRDGVGILGIAANEAAFRHGSYWLADTTNYLDENRRLLAKLIARNFPEVEHHMPEATYLAWLDCRRVAERLGEDNLCGRILNDAKLAVTNGKDFGSDGFIRLNFATSRNLLRETVRRLSIGLNIPTDSHLDRMAK